MTKRQVAKFRKILQTKRSELLRDLRERRHGLTIELAGDPVDWLRSLADQELTVRSVDLESALLREVDRALRGIEESTFGRCAWCDREIPPKRLEAVPWSPYCVACQELAEQERAAQPGLGVTELFCLPGRAA